MPGRHAKPRRIEKERKRCCSKRSAGPPLEPGQRPTKVGTRQAVLARLAQTNQACNRSQAPLYRNSPHIPIQNVQTQTSGTQCESFQLYGFKPSEQDAIIQTVWIQTSGARSGKRDVCMFVHACARACCVFYHNRQSSLGATMAWVPSLAAP